MEDEKSCRVGCMDESNLLLGMALDYFLPLHPSQHSVQQENPGVRKNQGFDRHILHSILFNRGIRG